MSRLLARRCSMSSIEEEDEPSTCDEPTVQFGKLSSAAACRRSSQLARSPSIADWDSELSESEQEYEGRRNQQRRKERRGERRKATCTLMKRRTEHMLTHFFDVLRLLISLARCFQGVLTHGTTRCRFTRTHALKLMRTRESIPLLISTFIELNLLTSSIDIQSIAKSACSSSVVHIRSQADRRVSSHVCQHPAPLLSDTRV